MPAYRWPRDFAVITNRPSRSAFAIRRSLGRNARVVRDAPGKSVEWHRYRIALNWGCSYLALAYTTESTLNQPSAVATVSNKLKFFETVGELPNVVPSTTCKDEAKEWLDCDEAKVMCRTLVKSHSGRGCVVARNEEDLVDAPLYTLYIKKRAEFRAHIFLGDVIGLQQKRKRSGIGTNYNPLVRSHANGWTYVVNNVDTSLLPNGWQDSLLRLARVCGLDFGAVDFCISSDDGKLYVFEINSAPGLESPTILEAYRSALLSYL